MVRENIETKLSLIRRLRIVWFTLRYGNYPRLASMCMKCSRLGWDEDMMPMDTWEAVQRVHPECFPLTKGDLITFYEIRK